MPRRYVPDAGDVVWQNFTPQAGHEQAGRRPALVLSPAAYNERAGLMVCCRMTTQIKNYPFEVLIAGTPPTQQRNSCATGGRQSPRATSGPTGC